MSKEKRRVPKLRFPGFTEDWEQRKLSDISTKVTTKNVDVHYMETLTNSAEQGIISQVDFFDKEISNKDNINGYYIVENNDFIYNPRISTLAPVGPINRNKLNRTGIMSPLYTVFRASNVDLGFLEWYFQSSYWHRYMKLNGDSGARADRIAIKDSTFFDMPIKTPVNIKEQVLIGEILEKFNQYITLHQRKLNNLKLKKKALLQKLFPKNGERYPELRFPGFTDAWEQRKLESLFTKYEDKVSTPDSGYWRLGLRSHCKGTFYTYVDAGHELETTEMYRVKAGNFILNITFAWERALAVTDDEDQGKLVSHRFPQFKPNDDLVIDFFKHTLMDKRFKHHLELSSPGGAGRNKVLKVSDMLKYELLVPSIQEQNIISSFLNNVDYIITLHQRKLDHLQLQKKALLQQMFV